MLEANKVQELFDKCAMKDIDPESVLIKAAVGVASMLPSKLKEHKEEIRELLMELPEQFRASSGGGWSFLNACMDKNGRQWGEHNHIDMLLVLGLGIGLVEFCLPRDMWECLPGGVPYFVIKDKDDVARGQDK